MESLQNCVNTDYGGTTEQILHQENGNQENINSLEAGRSCSKMSFKEKKVRLQNLIKCRANTERVLMSCWAQRDFTFKFPVLRMFYQRLKLSSQGSCKGQTFLFNLPQLLSQQYSPLLDYMQPHLPTKTITCRQLHMFNAYLVDFYLPRC